MKIKIGDRVRVKTSLVVYHHPQYRNQPFELKDQEGEVVEFASTYQMKDREVNISANFPIVVQFPDLAKRFRVHLREDELEVLTGES